MPAAKKPPPEPLQIPEEPLPGADGIGARLRIALAEWNAERIREKTGAARLGDGLNAFSKEMQKRIRRGASRPMLHRYLTGETIPPVEFCIAAAEVLPVSLNWLLTGVSAFPEGDEPDPTQFGLEWDLGAESLLRLTGGKLWEHVDPERDAMVGEPARLVEALVRERPDSFGGQFAPNDALTPRKASERIARTLGWIYGAPFEALGIDPANVPPLLRQTYLRAMGQALTAILPVGLRHSSSLRLEVLPKGPAWDWEGEGAPADLAQEGGNDASA